MDLAGSERLKASKTSNANETGKINVSLFTLGKVRAQPANLVVCSPRPRPSL